MSSDPDDDDSPDSGAPTGPRPMTALAATAWTVLATMLLGLFVTVLAGMRPGSEHDIVSGVACQGLAYLITLFLVLRVHAPDAGVRDFVGMRPTSVLFVPLAIGIGLAAHAPTDALFNAIERRWPSHVEDHIVELFWAATFPKRAAMAIAIILVGPALERSCSAASSSARC